MRYLKEAKLGRRKLSGKTSLTTLDLIWAAELRIKSGVPVLIRSGAVVLCASCYPLTLSGAVERMDDGLVALEGLRRAFNRKIGCLVHSPAMCPRLRSGAFGETSDK